MTLAEIDILVLCGGRGARLGPLTAMTPKPLLPVGGRPFLLRLLLQLRHEGIARVVLAAHYRHEQFAEFMESHRPTLPDMHLVIEREPLGTGGGLRHALQAIRSSTFIALNGDSWIAQPLAPVVAQHAERRRTFTAVAVQAARVSGGSLNKGVWTVGPQGEARGFETPPQATAGWVNAGLYVIDRAVAHRWPEGAYSLEASFPQLLAGQRAGVFCSAGSLLDIGTPECYAWADQALQATEALMPSFMGVADDQGH